MADENPIRFVRKCVFDVTQAEAFAPIYVRLAYQPT